MGTGSATHSSQQATLADQAVLCARLRAELSETIQLQGGHFASNLGTVELTVALLSAFNSPSDTIVWDTGHQAYPFKMLTGRWQSLSSIRKSNGISGFLKIDENAHDAFGAGHAGTSVSAALGIRIADGNHSSRHVIAVIGDGALTAGLAYEALNHAGALHPSRFIVVLNDNGMSISKNVGALSQGGGESIRAFSESLGFEYFGPIDGHDLPALQRALENLKDLDHPAFVQIRTQKGRGHAAAEINPVQWHSVSPPCLKPVAQQYETTFSELLGEWLELRMPADPRIVVVTPAMIEGSGLRKIAHRFPGRIFDVGICEQHAVTFAAGLARRGLRPVCAIYSTFLQRCYDQIVHDVCLQRLPVTFAIDRAGFVGADGETHQGLFDLGFLRPIPHLGVSAPANGDDLWSLLDAALKSDGPFAIRYPRAACARPANFLGASTSAEIALEGSDLLLLAIGPMVDQALTAARLLEESGIESTVENLRMIKPLDRDLLLRLFSRFKTVVTIEEHLRIGGVGSAVSEFVQDMSIRPQPKILCLGVNDQFVRHGSVDEQRRWCGLAADQVAATIKSYLSSRQTIDSRHERSPINGALQMRKVQNGSVA